MERAPDPFGEKIFPPTTRGACGRRHGRDGKPTASVKYRKASARCASIWRRRLARSAATMPPQTPCWPTSQCRSESARHWLRTGQSLQMAIAAAASCRACCAPGLTGNHTSASRLLSEHRACRMTRAHAWLLTGAGAGTPSGHTATWAGACAVAREWFGWAAGKPVICPLLSRFFRVSLSRAVSIAASGYSLPQLALPARVRLAHYETRCHPGPAHPGRAGCPAVEAWQAPSVAGS